MEVNLSFAVIFSYFIQLKLVTMTPGNTQRATAPSSSSSPSTQRSWSGGLLTSTRLS